MVYNLFLIIIFTSLFSSIFMTFFGAKVGLAKFYIPYFVFLFISLLYVFFQFMVLITTHAIIYIKYFDIISFDGYLISFSFSIDFLTVIMMFVVICISFFVFLFSIWYMKGDPNQLKFLNYLNFFMFFMLLLVSSDSLIIIFTGWEGIGLFSYLLINFWDTRLNANRSGFKAIIVNKFGDSALYAFTSFFFFLFGAFSDKASKCVYDSFQNDEVIFLNFDFTCVVFFSLFIAAVAKSAQFFLHVWLPDAMEGPTPVSALLHAATMVTAGAYLLIKYNWISHFSINAAIFIIMTGILTNFLSSIVAVFQNDLKKIIAYSTASQMGLIFIAIGINKPFLAFFHLYNHAFFKALLFILAGIIIHLLNNKQDSRLFSILKDKMFFLYSSFLISCLTLMGIPFLSAYYSKEIIINSVFLNLSILPSTVSIFLYISAFTTIIYTLKIFFFIFFFKEEKSLKANKIKEKYNETGVEFFQYMYSHDSLADYDRVVLIVCYVLVIISMLNGYFFTEIFDKSFLFFNSSVSENLFEEKSPVKIDASVMFIYAFYHAGFYFYAFCSTCFYKFKIYFTNFLSIINLASRKFLFDIWNYYFVKFFLIIKNYVKEEKNFNENFLVFYFRGKKIDFINVIKLVSANKTIFVILLVFFILDIFLFICLKPFLTSFIITFGFIAVLRYFKWI